MDLSLDPSGRWQRVQFGQIDALQDVVIGAGLNAVQMSVAPLSGTMAFAECDGISYSSAHIDGQVRLTGSLSQTDVTVGVGIRMPPGSREWLNELDKGCVGVFLPGDEQEGLWPPGTMFALATLSVERLEEEASRLGLVLDAKQLGGTGVTNMAIDESRRWLLEEAFVRLHAGRPAAGLDGANLSEYLLQIMLQHLAREPRRGIGPRPAESHGRIVSKAQDYIERNLKVPLTLAMIARAANVTQALLCSAFESVYGEHPQTFVQKLRLNRLRNLLASGQEAKCSIAMVAGRCSTAEARRLMEAYNLFFGEAPEATQARALTA
jgi:AraC-like DNA-binding protein